MSAKLCPKPGCGALARIGYPCKDWDCPQDVVSAAEYRKAADALTTQEAELAKTMKENERLSETFVDDTGLSWSPPTAWAYHAVCQARNAHQARADRAEAELRCPIGLDDARPICSAGSCKACIIDRLNHYHDRAEAAEAKLARLREALEPFGRNADATSLARVYAHLTREHAQTARALQDQGNG